MSDNDSKERFVANLTNSQDALYSYILSLFPYEGLARDVLQETNMVLWCKADEFNENLSFIAWACGVARFQVKAARRNMQRDRLVFDDELVGKLAVEAEQYAANDEFSDMLSECVSELSMEQRELVVDRYLPGSSLKALAHKLRRSVAGLAVTLFRIRQMLAKCLEQKMTSRGRS